MTDDVRKAVETTYSEWLGKSWDDLCGDLAEARAQIAVLREALEPATKELNAIRARDGAPQHIDWYRGQPLQTDSCTHEWWNELTEKCWAALDATPADCLKQIRAEVLEEAASVADRLSVPKSKGPKTLSSPYSEHGKLAKAHSSAAIDATKQTGRRIATEIRALKDKP